MDENNNIINLLQLTKCYS